MRWMYRITCLLLYPLVIVAQEPPISKLFFDVPYKQKNNTEVRLLTSEQDNFKLSNSFERSINSPTHIIRMVRNINNPQFSCEQVNKEIDQKFVNKITKDKFIFATYISCTYDPETRKAIEFTINSYFDPLNDEAASYLKVYMDEYNGMDLMESQLTIEQAKAVIVSLNFSAGWKKNPAIPPFTEYRKDRSNFYFKNNFELKNILIADIEASFFSDDPEIIMPLLDKWIFSHASIAYKATLLDSNYTIMEPEKIFLMDSGEPLFVSPIKIYYQHNCSKYEHGRCLKPKF